MALYLQMDGVDDKITLPSMTYKDILIDMELQEQSYSTKKDFANYGGTGGTTAQFYRQTNGTDTHNVKEFQLNGATATKGTIVVPYNQKVLFRLVGWIDYTGPGTIFAHPTNINYNLKGKIYNIKVYNNAGALVAHYDMSTGTVQDQSGNGYHATLTGGTWADDGTGGGDAGTTGSVSYSTKNVIYRTATNNYDFKQSVYKVEQTTPSLKQLIYKATQNHSDLKQTLYKNNAAAFDTLQNLYNDSLIFKADYQLKQVINRSVSSTYALRQEMYKVITGYIDLKQKIILVDSFRADTKQIVTNHIQTQIMTLQAIYEHKEITNDVLISILVDYQEFKSIVEFLLNITTSVDRNLSITTKKNESIEITQRKNFNLNI
jgi:hypothetical protein